MAWMPHGLCHGGCIAAAAWVCDGGNNCYIRGKSRTLTRIYVCDDNFTPGSDNTLGSGQPKPGSPTGDDGTHCGSVHDGGNVQQQQI